MDELKFVKLLQQRAREQYLVMEKMPFPGIFLLVTKWLSDHPWRYLIPLAFLITLTLRYLFGTHFSERVLKLFYIL